MPTMSQKHPEDEYTWLPTCKMCNKPLIGKRGGAKFCCGNCRKRWSRRRVAIEDAAGKARWEIGQLRYLGKQYEDLRPALCVQLKLLQADITDLLAMYDPVMKREIADKNELMIGLGNRRTFNG